MSTNNPTTEEVLERTARYDELQPMSTAKDLAHLPQAAMDIVFARKLMPVILDEGSKTPFGDKAAIYGAAGATMFISVCPPGQGPCLHSHDLTYETFMVLEGSFEFNLGDEAQETVVLNKWDTFSCPPGVYRGFTNVSDKDSVLLTFVTGDVNAKDDVVVPPKITHKIRDEFGEDVLNSFKTIAAFHE